MAFIGIALVLVVIAAMELSMLFRMHRDPARTPGQAESVAGREDETYVDADTPAGAGVENADLPNKTDGDWRMVLVNDKNPLPEDFRVRLADLRSGVQVDERILDPLHRMLDAAKKEGFTIVASSGYRSVDRQRVLYRNKVARLLGTGLSEAVAQAEAVKEVAYPGTSEHHLGLALDLVAGHNQRLDDSQGETPENQWLREHCHVYGFILRYPLDKSDKTGVIYEPWHFRYTGQEAAKSIMEQGLCLEEYLEQLADTP